MTTLIEIDAALNRNATGNGRTVMTIKDIGLLIRAVRQLGEVYKAAYQEDKSVAFFVDHDVLALLEEGR